MLLMRSSRLRSLAFEDEKPREILNPDALLYWLGEVLEISL